MTARRPLGGPFLLDLAGTVITGRYLEVDPPYRMLIEWGCSATDQATPTAALIRVHVHPDE